MINQSRFSNDGQHLVTLLNSGEVLLWGLDSAMQLDSTAFQLRFRSNALTCFDSSFNHLVVGGKDLSYLIVKDLISKSEHYFRLPSGCRGIE